MPGYGMNATGDIVLTAVSDYTMTDFSLSKNFNNQLAVTAGIKNLFDVTSISRSATAAAGSGGAHTASSSSLPLSTGRSYFIGIGYKYAH